MEDGTYIAKITYRTYRRELAGSKRRRPAVWCTAGYFRDDVMPLRFCRDAGLLDSPQRWRRLPDPPFALKPSVDRTFVDSIQLSKVAKWVPSSGRFTS